jgi:hypothetical protein
MLPSDVTIGLKEIVCHFDELEDPRSTINRLHRLPSVLAISLMGVLAGASLNCAPRPKRKGLRVRISGCNIIT